MPRHLVPGEGFEMGPSRGGWSPFHSPGQVHQPVNCREILVDAPAPESAAVHRVCAQLGVQISRIFPLVPSLIAVLRKHLLPDVLHQLRREQVGFDPLMLFRVLDVLVHIIHSRVAETNLGLPRIGQHLRNRIRRMQLSFSPERKQIPVPFSLQAAFLPVAFVTFEFLHSLLAAPQRYGPQQSACRVVRGQLPNLHRGVAGGGDFPELVQNKIRVINRISQPDVLKGVRGF
mmetsp:Transcript_18013/g.45028  ORF Transcript_18013/g.45028 Transcript_18013/m.45028 type:complete len:231 (-) Transcript_18013:2197-2889(-)